MNSDIFEHANHNHEAFQYIRSSEKFNDWAITTAFYSALHFVRARAQKIGIFQEFESWYAAENQREQMNGNRRFNGHEATKILASRLSRDCGLEYDRLLSWAKNSRYNDYKVSRDRVKCAAHGLEKIKSTCCPPESPAKSTANDRKA